MSEAKTATDVLVADIAELVACDKGIALTPEKLAAIRGDTTPITYQQAQEIFTAVCGAAAGGHLPMNYAKLLAEQLVAAAHVCNAACARAPA